MGKSSYVSKGAFHGQVCPTPLRRRLRYVVRVSCNDGTGLQSQMERPVSEAGMLSHVATVGLLGHSPESTPSARSCRRRDGCKTLRNIKSHIDRVSGSCELQESERQQTTVEANNGRGRISTNRSRTAMRNQRLSSGIRSAMAHHDRVWQDNMNCR